MEAILFTGIPASGKSTFYQERFFATHVRLNLDMLKTRKREFLVLQARLAAKQPFVVDNPAKNAGLYQRSEKRTRPVHRACQGCQIPHGGLLLPTGLAKGPGKKPSAQWQGQHPRKGLIARHSQLQIPSLDEGFDQLSYVMIDPGSGEFVVREWEDEIR